MKSGRQTLSSLESAIQRLNGEEQRIDQAMRSAAADAERFRSERMDALRELARVKLDEMTAGRLVSGLDAAERRALQLIENSRLRLESTAERRQSLVGEVEAAQKERDAAAADVEAALEAVETARAEAEAKVRTTEPWQTAKKAFDDAAAVANEAEKKATVSEAELGRKKQPYDDDPLFTYLWRAGYGTRAYTAGGFVRMVDDIVARFIGFTDARANYAMLTEIAARLREHARAQRAKADAQQAALARIELGAMIEAGVVVLEKRLAETRFRLATLDDTLEKKTAMVKALDAERSALIDEAGDKAYNQAIETMAVSDAKDDLQMLMFEARRTATAADEAIVRRIGEIEAKIEAAEREVAEIRKTARDLAARRGEVEGAREKFRRAGYDHPHATFGNDLELDDVIENIVTGAVRSGILWDLLRAGFGMRAPRGRPDFGQPNFPFPFPIPGGGSDGPRGGGWREPTSRGGWSPSGGGDRDRGDRDGFSTGGSF